MQITRKQTPMNLMPENKKSPFERRFFSNSSQPSPQPAQVNTKPAVAPKKDQLVVKTVSPSKSEAEIFSCVDQEINSLQDAIQNLNEKLQKLQFSLDLSTHPVLLTKITPLERIEVIIHTKPDEELEQKAQRPEEEDVDDSPREFVEFEVTVLKKKKNKRLIFRCIYDGTFDINEVTITTKDTGGMTESPARFPQLREHFIAFLKERGIDKEFGELVKTIKLTDFGDDEYPQWLQQLKQFFSPEQK